MIAPTNRMTRRPTGKRLKSSTEPPSSRFERSKIVIGSLLSKKWGTLGYATACFLLLIAMLHVAPAEASKQFLCEIETHGIGRRLTSQVVEQFKRGDRVEANYKGKGKWYPATFVRKSKSEGYYSITYDNAPFGKKRAPKTHRTKEENVRPPPYEVRCRKCAGKSSLWRWEHTCDHCRGTGTCGMPVRLAVCRKCKKKAAELKACAVKFYKRLPLKKKIKNCTNSGYAAKYRKTYNETYEGYNFCNACGGRSREMFYCQRSRGMLHHCTWDACPDCFRNNPLFKHHREAREAAKYCPDCNGCGEDEDGDECEACDGTGTAKKQSEEEQEDKPATSWFSWFG